MCGNELAAIFLGLALRNTDTSLFRKTDRFRGPASTWSVQNSLDNADAGRTLAQDFPAPLVDSPTGDYTNTGTHSSSLWLSFFAIVQQGRALERRLRSAQRHKYALPRLPEIYRKPLKSGYLFTPDTLDGTNGVRIIEVPLYL